MAEQWEYRQGPGYTRAAGFGPQQPRPVHSQPPATPPQFRRDDPPTAPPPPSFTPGYQSQRPRAQYAPQQPAWQPQPPPVQQPWQPPVQQPWQPPKPPRKNRAGLIGCTGLSGVVFVILLAVAFSNSPSSTTPPAAQTGTGTQAGAPVSAQGYLSDGQGFSRLGLISQLDSPDGDNFPVADATWAVDHSGANWDAQAVDSARTT